MFKFETLVRVLMVTAISSAAAANAEETKSRLTDHQFNELRKDEVTYGCRDPKMRIKNSEVCERIETALGQRSKTGKGKIERCEDAKEEFSSSKSTFESACGILGIRSGGKEGSIGCSFQKERCQCLDKGFEDPDDEYNCAEVRSTGSGSRARSSETSRLGLIDLKHAEQQMKWCPDKNPEDTERYEKQLEKAQERIKDLKKKMPELLTKGNEAQDKATEKQNDAQRKAVEAQKEFANEMKEIKRKKEGDEQQAVAEMAQIRENIDKVDAQIREYELNKVDAEVGFQKAKTEIELNCHANASTQVARLQAERMALLKQKKYTPGGFHALMRSVGVSDRDAWENRAEVYYKRCLVSRPTRDSKIAAQKIYESTTRRLDTAIAAARKSRTRMEESLTQIMTASGCKQPQMQSSGMTGESKMCRSMRQAHEDMQQAHQNAVQQQQQIQQEVITAQRQLAQKNQTLQMEYADAQRELNDEIARMENLRAYLDLKRKSNSGAGTKKAAEDLHSSFGKLRSAAFKLDGCCIKEGHDIDNCKEVDDFIDSLGGKSQQRGKTQVDQVIGTTEPQTARPAGGGAAPSQGTTPQTSPSRATTR